MKFSSSFLALLAASAMQFVSAVPASTGELSKRAPVGVSSLKCDGDTYKCTANLKYGDGKWVAQWPSSIFHKKSFTSLSGQELAIMSPVGVKTLYCDGDTYLCTGILDYGDGNWVAQWTTAVKHQSMFSDAAGNEVVVSHEDSAGLADILMCYSSQRIQGAVKVVSLTCDGDTYKCTGKLDFGDGRWIAQWSTSVFHSTSFLDESSLFLQ